MPRYFSTKTYGNERGLSCCFRQHKAEHSHCAKLHGYSLGFRITFEADELDSKNWVQDFGGLDEIYKFLEEQFDHTMAVAEDDPELDAIQTFAAKVANIKIMPAVGCEAFAHQVYEHVEDWLKHLPDNSYENMMGDKYPRVKVKSVECFEHAGNSATYGD
jgi:6-pyruvoyltetrahydropterin/6-carboxytetrahydropterin synthase